jgi:hypothetical protein
MIVIPLRVDHQLGPLIRQMQDESFKEVLDEAPHSKMMFDNVLEILPENVTCIDVGAIIARALPIRWDRKDTLERCEPPAPIQNLQRKDVAR